MDAQVMNVALITVTPEDAGRMLREFPYERQRPINLDTVAFYAEIMAAGDWFPGEDIEIAHAPNEDGAIQGHLLNGQHRLSAVFMGNVPIVFTIRHIMFPDMDGVARRYGSIDMQKKRSVVDQNRALGMPERLGLNEVDTKSLTSAIPFLENGFKHGSKYLMTPSERIGKSFLYASAMQLIHTYMEGGVTRLTYQMHRVGPLAVALATVFEARKTYGDDRTREFWNGVVRDDGLKMGDPRKVAVRALFEHLQGAVGKRRDSQEYTARALINCWNGWIEGRDMKQTRVPDVRGAVEILGTHFDGKALKDATTAD